ncbi:MAG: hypothetical protein LBK13_11470 [Spirochaetales bacterium]|nr:hypothetical protein [Spirochaetales bacterium]
MRNGSGKSLFNILKNHEVRARDSGGADSAHDNKFPIGNTPEWGMIVTEILFYRFAVKKIEAALNPKRCQVRFYVSRNSGTF